MTAPTPGFFDAAAKKRMGPSWRDQIEVHPAAALFPLMSETDPDGLSDMAVSIAMNPLKVPDLMPVIHAELLNPDCSSLSQSKWKFTLLDGRNRLDAMELAGIKFALRPNERSLPSTPGWLLDVDRGDLVVSHPLEVERDDPWEYVRRANVERRMMNRAEKRELIKRLLKHAPEKSDRAIAEMAMSHKNVVKSVRGEEEARGHIAHVKTRVDSKGRRSPARRKTKTTSRRPPAGTEQNSPTAAPAATPDTPAATTAAAATQTAPSKPPLLRWIDGSEGEPWTGDMKAQTLIGHAADGKEFWVERYLSDMNPVFQVRVTIKEKLKTLQQAIDIAEAYNADPNAPLPKTASKPAAKGDNKKTGAEAPAPRPELTPEASAAERKAQHAAAENLAIPGFLLRKQATDEAAT
jgi:hypothetical protein